MTLNFLMIFENLSGLNGLMTKLGSTHMTQNCLNMSILTIFDRKSSISAKNDISVWLLNPLMTTVPVWGRQNHVVFQASYLKNGWEFWYENRYLFWRGGNFLQHIQKLAQLEHFYGFYSFLKLDFDFEFFVDFRKPIGS